MIGRELDNAKEGNAEKTAAATGAETTCMEDVAVRHVITELLLSLGIGRQYRGHHMAAEAVATLIHNGAALLKFRQLILAPIAQRYACDWQCVERNLRTVIHRAWQLNPERLKEITMYPLTSEPSAAEFIDILAAHIMQKCQLWALDASITSKWAAKQHAGVTKSK